VCHGRRGAGRAAGRCLPGGRRLGPIAGRPPPTACWFFSAIPKHPAAVTTCDEDVQEIRVTRRAELDRERVQAVVSQQQLVVERTVETVAPAPR
jgi:hypothetical protein